MFKQILYVPESIKAHLQGDVFEAVINLQGKAFRDVPGRKTMRVQINNKNYFIKQHFGVGWREIFKNLISFKMPILGAMTEVNAIKKLDKIGIATTPLVAYGQRGYNPATMQSFLITEDLGDIVSLEEMLQDSKTYPMTDESKRLMLIAVAKIAAKLHGAGQSKALAHRDFYLCHFVLSRQNAVAHHYDLHLIDLHRMLQNQSPNGNAVMKDIAGLYFSMLQNGLGAQDLGAQDLGAQDLGARDLSLFKQHYLPQTAVFWAKVDKRANKLFSKFNSAKFQQRLAKEKAAIH